MSRNPLHMFFEKRVHKQPTALQVMKIAKEAKKARFAKLTSSI